MKCTFQIDDTLCDQPSVLCLHVSSSAFVFCLFVCFLTHYKESDTTEQWNSNSNSEVKLDLIKNECFYSLKFYLLLNYS